MNLVSKGNTYVDYDDFDDCQYAPADGCTPLLSCIRLISAVRAMAVQDGKLEDWEAYWLHAQPWPEIWGQLEKLRETRHLVRVDGGLEL